MCEVVTYEWPLLKYKEVNRNKRRESANVRVVVDVSKRTLKVFCGVEEVEMIYCNMAVSKFPSLKIKDDFLFVLTNRQSQGFRLTFHSENRNQFLAVMRRICFISETPEKNHLNRTFTNTDKWNQRAIQKIIILLHHNPFLIHMN
uniref:IRS-type PTB domain-containing protein n=1 Tax=Caenorhabditis tropicalis TaxID=1561998 RepID=A0A1I7TX67_9PELO